MKKHLFVLSVLMILNLVSYSQILFEKGYFINEASERIECLIKNIDWKNNPSKFEYKLTKDAIVQEASIENVKEFGIYDVSKYIRKTVQIDKSSSKIDKLSTDMKPIYEKEQLFLKVLIEGKATLYVYEETGIIRFFYKTIDTEVNQLVYKAYLTDNGNIVYNKFFKQQIYRDLKSQTIHINELKNIDYTKSDLKKIFIKYNESVDSNYKEFEQKEKKNLFHLTITPGLNFSRMKIENSLSETRNTDFGNQTGFRFGIEAEFILPYNKNKWGIILEPTYQYYESSTSKETNDVSGGILVSKVDYRSIELPIGVRHYFYLNNQSKIFANILFVLDFNKDSPIVFSRNDGSTLSSIDINSIYNFAFGAGFNYRNKYHIEFRYLYDREVLSNYSSWSSNYSTFSVILGYSLF